MKRYTVNIYKDPEEINLYYATGEGFKGLVMSAFSIDVLMERIIRALSDLFPDENTFEVEYKMDIIKEIE